MICKKSRTLSCRSKWKTSKRSSSPERGGSPSIVISKTLTQLTFSCAHGHHLHMGRWSKHSRGLSSRKHAWFSPSNSSIGINSSPTELLQDLIPYRLTSIRCSKFNKRIKIASSRAKANLSRTSRFPQCSHSRTSRWRTAARTGRARTRWVLTTDWHRMLTCTRTTTNLQSHKVVTFKLSMIPTNLNRSRLVITTLSMMTNHTPPFPHTTKLNLSLSIRARTVDMNKASSSRDKDITTTILTFEW